MSDPTMPDPTRPSFDVVTLAGDGVGAEVMDQAVRAIEVVNALFKLNIRCQPRLIGGAAVDECGDPAPEETLAACKNADAVLLGAVGGPAWDRLEPSRRPETGLLRLRAELALYCNLRPVATHPALHEFSPLESARLDGVDMMLVRELTGGIYFGKKQRDGDQASDLCVYTRDEIKRITRKACMLAGRRRGKLTMVDKANVLETSRLWREVVAGIVSQEFPELDYETLLVDAAAMHLLTRPADFDVLLTENLFGDILSDEASMLCGSMGLLPSASLGDDGPGLYEPVHGSAPDIAGKGLANPHAMLLSVALMLRHSLDCEPAATALENAIRQSWEAGELTRDLRADGLSTKQAADCVLERLTRSPADSREWQKPVRNMRAM